MTTPSPAFIEALHNFLSTHKEEIHQAFWKNEGLAVTCEYGVGEAVVQAIREQLGEGQVWRVEAQRAKDGKEKTFYVVAALELHGHWFHGGGQCDLEAFKGEMSLPPSSEFLLGYTPLLHTHAARRLVEAINANDEDRVVRLIEKRFPWPLAVDEVRLLPTDPKDGSPQAATFLVNVLMERGFTKALAAFTKATKADLSAVLGLAVHKAIPNAVQVLLDAGCSPNGSKPWSRPIFWLKRHQIPPVIILKTMDTLTQHPEFDPWAPTQAGAHLFRMAYGKQSFIDPTLLPPPVCLPLALLRENNERDFARMLDVAHAKGIAPPPGALDAIMQQVKLDLMGPVHDFAVFSLGGYESLTRQFWGSLARVGAVPPLEWVDEVLEGWSTVNGRPSIDEAHITPLFTQWARAWQDPALTEKVVQVCLDHNSQDPSLGELLSGAHFARLAQQTPTTTTPAIRKRL